MTAKRRSRAAQQWMGDSRDGALDGLFSSMKTEAQEVLGQEVSIGTESESMLVGLPLPALSLRYLFQSTTFPLSRITQLTGEEGSAKTAMLYEIFRWHMVYGGGSVLMENEDKDSPELRQSILQWHPHWLNRMEVLPTHSLEEWQDGLTSFVEIARNQQDHRDGPGRTIPIAFGVDSIMATAPQSEIDAVLKDGHSSRGFALAANLIARYMRTMPALIKKYPFSVIGTNHLKPSTDPRGFPTANIPGGKAVKFMETYEIEMKKTQNPDIDLLQYGGLRIKLIGRKNSLGPSRKSIQAELLWWWQDVAGTFRQMTAWDWDTCSVELLLSFENAKGKKTIYNRLMEICDIRVTSKSERLAYSRVLGISKDDPQLFRMVGATLESRPELLSQIYQVLGITPRRPFQPGVDYRDLLATAREEATAAAANLYANVEQLPTVAPVNADELEEFSPDGEEGATSEERAAADAASGEFGWGEAPT